MIEQITVHVYELFGDKKEQGRLVATGKVSNYKMAIANGARAFVRDHRPPEGRYMIVAPDERSCGPQSFSGACSIFDVKYPRAVIESDGHTEILGGVFGWGAYTTSAPSEWQRVNERITNAD